MGRVALTRLIRMIVTWWGVVTLAFILPRLSGDPVALMAPETATPAEIEVLRHDMGLDQPAIVQYGQFFGDLVHGNTGTSIVYRTSALDVALARLPATAELAVTAMTITLLLGLTVGILAAARPNSLFGRVAVAAAVMGRSTPAFVFGIFLLLFLSVQMRLLPTGGRGSLANLVMPALTLAYVATPTLIRITRAGMLEAMRGDYVRTARAKGLGTGAILWRHALRNAALPIVTIIGVQFGGMLSGSAIVETLFAWPGMGYLAIQSIAQRDYPVVQTVLLLAGTWFIVANTIVDVTYSMLDPRTKSR